MKKTELSDKRVKLIRMEDPYTKLVKGDEGTIKGEDDAGHILVQWDNGSTLNLIKDIDEYEVLESRKIERFFEFILSDNNPEVTHTTDYIRVKSQELVDLFKDEYNVYISVVIIGDEIKFNVGLENDTFLFRIDVEKMMIYKSFSYGVEGQPEDVHKEEEWSFDSIDEAFEILEKELHKILRISESGFKKIKSFKVFENKSIYDLGIKVVDASANNNDGGVQIDDLTITVDGDSEFSFEIATTVGGDIYVTYEYGDGGDFTDHFELEDGEKLSDSELKDFLRENEESCVGNAAEIDGFEIEITDFSHRGGLEFGFLRATINGEEFQLDVEQDATGNGLDCKCSYFSKEDEEVGKRNGLDLESDEAQGFFFDNYDRICNEKRP